MDRPARRRIGDAWDDAGHAPSIYLHHREPRQGLRQEGRPQGDLALLLPGGQDRRDRRQRVGQEHAAADHGRGRDRLPRHGAARGGDLDRVRAAGADPRPLQGRPRQRRAGRRAGPRPAGAVRRHQRPARRADRRRRDGRAARGAGQGAGRHRGGRGVGPRPPRSRSPWTPCACPPATPTSPPSPAASAAAWRSARSCSRGPTSSSWTSRPTTSTPRASPGSNGTSRTIRAPSSRSPTTATSSTTSPAGSSNSTAARASPGRATTRPGSSRSRSGCARGEAGERPPQDPGPRAGVGPHGPARPRRQEPRPPAALRATGQPGCREARRGGRAPDPPGPHLGDLVVEAEGVRKGFGDRLLVEDMTFRLPPGGIVGVIGPNGAGKTTLFRMIVGQETARRRRAPRRRHRGRLLRRPEPRHARARQHDLPGDHRRARPGDAGQAQGPGAGLRGAVQLQGARPGEEGRQPLRAASGTASTWPSCSRAAATSCSWTSRPTTSTSTCSAPWRRPCSTSAAAP